MVELKVNIPVLSETSIYENKFLLQLPHGQLLEMEKRAAEEPWAGGEP